MYDVESVTGTDSCDNHRLMVTCTNGNTNDPTNIYQYPSCTEPPACVLKRFLKGVANGQITYSKVRNAMATASTNESTTLTPYSSGYTLGYGELLSGVNYGYTRTSLGLPGEYIIRSPIIGLGQSSNSLWNRYISQIELYGITLATEGTNR